MNRLLKPLLVRSIATKLPKLPKDVPPHRMAEIEEEEKSEHYNCENEKWITNESKEETRED